ncbi:MAG: hypothetical protein ABFC65_06690 [Rectinema sp.]
MKKLIVLLLAVVMVGAAFAQTPTVSASSTLSWGVDLDTGNTGFKNANDITIEVPFTLEDAEKKGDKGWWGEIAISNLTFILSDDALSANDPLTFTDVDGDGNPASISAKITNGTWALGVDSKEDFDFNSAEQLYSGDVAVVIDADTMGASVSYTANGLTAGVTAASKGDWTTNAANEYALGANMSYDLTDSLTVSGGLAYDAFDADKEFGVTASVAYDAAPLTVTVAGDGYYDTAKFDFDGSVTVGYAVMEDFDATVIGYYSTGDDDLEAQVAVDYLVDPVEAGVWFGVDNPLTGIVYDLGLYGGYTLAVDEATEFYVRADYTNDLAGTQTLVPKASLTNTSIQNATLLLEYNGDELDVLAGTYGTLIASVTIEL